MKFLPLHDLYDIKSLVKIVNKFVDPGTANMLHAPTGENADITNLRHPSDVGCQKCL